MLTYTITNKRLAYRGYYDISEAYKSLFIIEPLCVNGTYVGERGRLLN